MGFEAGFGWVELGWVPVAFVWQVWLARRQLGPWGLGEVGWAQEMDGEESSAAREAIFERSKQWRSGQLFGWE